MRVVNSFVNEFNPGTEILFSYYKTSIAVALIAWQQKYNRVYSERSENQKNALKYLLWNSHSVCPEATLSAPGSYLVEQPHEEDGQAGVDHIVEGDEPVFVRSLWGDDRVCVTDEEMLPT